MYRSTMTTVARSAILRPSAAKALYPRSLSTSAPRRGSAPPNPGSDLWNAKEMWRKASPRTKTFVVLGVAVAAIAEGGFWATFGPRIFGKGKTAE
ncbi:hypothetical protein BN1723_001873 [Verticillium longisporum]|uniref:Uncharacterized protein n=2 Tax=Verticillium longisporum TaxID=100787 RepID=A0A0G4KS63_VERLO|nr:hypothetical protein BN1723_001873 [Verticillium longisporum]